MLKKAKFTMPEMTAKTVWYGSYGGHYDCMVFFKEKPKLVNTHNYDGCVDLIEEGRQNNIIASMWPDEFTKLTGIEIIPEEIEIVKLHKIELTAPWDEDGRLWGYGNNADGWV